jgi:hypothetical protein
MCLPGERSLRQKQEPACERGKFSGKSTVELVLLPELSAKEAPEKQEKNIFRI